MYNLKQSVYNTSSIGYNHESHIGSKWVWDYTEVEVIRLFTFNRSSDTMTNMELKRWRLTFHTITALEVEHS